MSLQPLDGFILLEPINDPTTTQYAGLVSVDGMTDKPARGTVLAISLNSPVKVGKKVVFKRWSGTDIKEDGKEVIFVKFEDLLGIYED